MLQYILLILSRQRGRSVLAAGGFLLAACALILLSATTLTTVVQAKQIISQNWRSSYDLVVLPSHTSIPTNQPISVNTFEGYDGGISVQQYKQIKSLTGVAVAAPLAFIGYAQYPFTFFQAGSIPPMPGYYQLEWTETAFNGHNQLIENHHLQRFYIDPGSQSCTITAPCVVDSSITGALTKLGIYSGWTIGDGQYRDALPDVGTYLLAAVDPVAENQLFHLQTGLVSGRILSPQDTLHLDTVAPSFSANNTAGPNYDVPLLLNMPASGQVNLSASLVRFQTNILDPRILLARQGAVALQHLPQQIIFSGSVPLARNNAQLFSSGTFLKQSGNGWQLRRDTYQASDYALNLLNFTSVPAGLTYSPTTAPSRQNTPAYRLIPGATQPLNSTNVAFLPLTPVPGSTIHINSYNINTIDDSFQFYNGAVYTPKVVGVFDGQRITAELTKTLSWLPEAAYASTSYTLRYDAQGHPVQSNTLLPTSQPGSFIQQPPFALTTLSAAERIRGSHCISVIRVRIAGNITPDEAGLRRVAQVAQEIHQSTGLRTIVTLGSSSSPTLVYVPGIKAGQNGATQTIAPLGWVEERWVDIGVGVSYLNQLGQTQTLFLGAILLVCFGYLAVTLSALVAAQRREMALLGALGWEPGQPVGIFLAQVFLLALTGGVVGIGIALLLVVLIGASPPWLIVAWTIPIILGMALLSALYPLWQLWRVQPAEVLREGMAVSSSRVNPIGSWLSAHLPAVEGMALRNLSRSRLRTVIAFGCLFLSAGLLTIMIDGLLTFRYALQGTLLGNDILLQTAVPQLTGASFAVLLTFLSVADLLLLQVRERRKEIGLLQAVGWRPRLVQRLFVQEGLMLALAGTLPGVLFALLILASQHQVQGAVPAPLVALGAVMLMLLVSALATLPAMRAANRIPLMDILRAE